MKSAKELQVRRSANAGHQVSATNAVPFDSDSLPCLEDPGLTAASFSRSLESDSGSTDTETISVGDLIADRYAVTEVVSQNCLAATDGVDGRSVLLKIVEGSSQELRDIANAAKRSSEISHPSLVRVVGFQQTPNHAFIISESVDGRTLREEIADRLERDQRFTIEEVLKVAVDVCRCLQVCHARMAHGQISVDTILITTDGCTRLVDYGLPCDNGLDHAGRNCPQTPATRAQDLRDLAAVLYELLTGQEPGPLPIAPHLIRHSVPVRLSRVIVKGLSYRRLASSVDPRSFERRLTRATKRKTHPAVIVISVVLACVATSVVVSGVRTYQTRQAKLEAERLANKPEYAKRLGKLRLMQQHAEALMTSVASESKRLQQEVEKCEKELANAEDGNKTMQAANARQKLGKLRPQYDMAMTIHEHWNRHANRQQWMTDVAGLFSAAESQAKDENYIEAIDFLKPAEVILNRLVNWHNSIPSRLHEMDQLSARLDECVDEYSSLAFSPYSEPQRLFQEAQKSLTSDDGSDAGDILKSVEQQLDAIDELMPLRLELEQLRQTPRVVSELPELQEQYNRIDESLVRGDTYLESGNVENAGQQYCHAKTRYREMPVAIVETLLAMFHASRNPQEAMYLLDEALLVPLDAEYDQNRREQVYLSRADIRIELGELRRAIDDLNTVIRLNPGNASFYVKRADLWNELRDTDAAITDYERAISLDDDMIDVGIRLAELYAANRQVKLAAERYGWVLARCPENMKARLARATISAQAGWWSDALKDSCHVLTHDQTLLAAWQIRTMANYELRNFNDAVEDSSRLIEVTSDSAMGYAYRAAAYLENGQFDAAIKDATSAIRIDPSSAWCYRIRAKARFGKGEADSARQDYQLAMRLAAERAF